MLDRGLQPGPAVIRLHRRPLIYREHVLFRRNFCDWALRSLSVRSRVIGARLLGYCPPSCVSLLVERAPRRFISVHGMLSVLILAGIDISVVLEAIDNVLRGRQLLG